MALYDAPTHRVTLYSTTAGITAATRDTGGGTALTYTSAQAAVPCLINTISANEQLRYAQVQVIVTHTIAFLSSVLTVTLAQEWKIVDDDTGDTYRIKGLRKGRQQGGIPAFTYADVEELTE